MGQGAQSWAANASFDNGNEKDSNLYLQIALRQIWFRGQTKLMWNLRGWLSHRCLMRGVIEFLHSSTGPLWIRSYFQGGTFRHMRGFVLFKWQFIILPPMLVLILRMEILQVGEAYWVVPLGVSFPCANSVSLLFTGECACARMHTHAHTELKVAGGLSWNLQQGMCLHHDLAAGPRKCLKCVP